MKNMDQENVLRNMDLLSRGFLMLHMLLLFLFFMSGAYIMIVVSLITVLIVGVSLWFAKREMLRWQTMSIYLAQLVEIIFSAFCVGWTAGLLIPLLSVTIFVFLCEYIGRFYGGGVCELVPSEFKGLAIPYRKINKHSVDQLDHMFRDGVKIEKVIDYVDDIVLSGLSHDERKYLIDVRKRYLDRRLKDS